MEISEVFEPGGILSASLSDYETRPEQHKMAVSVHEALGSGVPLVVEAGTGTGKTLAYLVPAVLSGSQVVISTGTKNLQEQVFLKDIPFLQKHLNSGFSAVMLKGRSNYLCPSRLSKFAQAPLFNNSEDANALEQIFSWSKKTKTGDKSELVGLPEESRIWNQVCSTPDFCGALKCPRQTDCFIGRLRKKAEESQIIVVNHHLFFADLAIRERGFGGVLPDYDAVVFDEAHLVEEIASQYFGFSVSNYRMEELVRDTVREIDGIKSAKKGRLIKDLDNFESRIKNFFHSFATKRDRRFSIADHPPEPEPSEILLTTMEALESELSALPETSDGIKAVSQRYLSLKNDLESMLVRDDPQYIYWGETRGQGVFLNASSIDVAPVLKDNLYSRATVICTSATLSTAGEFKYFQSRLGLEDAKTMLLPSPFDYANQASIYIPRIPEPENPKYLDSLAAEALQVIKLIKGRTLFLFTSFRNMYEIRKKIDKKIGYPILMQGEAPRHLLLEEFRDEVDSVLFATSSFWQGVDVRGESLSCVIIDRLPFASPADPVLSARIERIKQNGGNPFIDYQLPFAVLGLKQGLGRLIRHRHDRGVMVIADRRIMTKQYGKVFLASLPPSPIVELFENINWE